MSRRFRGQTFNMAATCTNFNPCRATIIDRTGWKASG
jgi:hypothetical protein